MSRPAREEVGTAARRQRRLVADPLAEHVVGSPRDLDVLESLAWAGLLTRAQVQALHFPSPRTAQRRLRALLDAGLVRASLQNEALHRDNVWTLTALGRERLLETGEYPDGLRRAARLPRPQKLAHALLVRDAFVTARLHAATTGWSLEDFLFDDDLVAAEPFRSHALVPDGLARFVRGSAIVIAIEVDRGTETRPRLREKFEKWARLFEAPATACLPAGACLVALALRETRRRALADILEEAGLAARAAALLQGALPEWLRTRCTTPSFAPALRAARTGSTGEPARFRAVTTTGQPTFRGVRSET